MESLRKQAARILGEQRKYKIWLTAFLCLALLVTAGTVAALTLSGQALTADKEERELDCQAAVHRHTEQCYDSEGQLICGQADYVIHTHDESCYGEDGELVCTLAEMQAEGELHVHDAACFTEQQVLTCGQEESQGHQHGEECYTKVQGELICEAEGTEHQHGPECYEKVKGDLTCTTEESGHQHSPECYTKTKGDLTCGKEESQGHQHSPECYTKVKGDLTCTAGEGHQHGAECYTKVKGDLTCTSQEEGHEHTDECYAWNEELTCGQTEESHEHTDECYAWTEELTCGQTEEEPHTHTDECYAWNEELTCGQTEEEGHTHTDECYAWTEELTCEIPEGLHEHTDECYAWTEELTCETAEGEGAHTHTEECYETQTVCSCGQLAAVEHVHGEECFKIVETEEPVVLQKVYQDSEVRVTAVYGEDANIPEEAQLVAEVIARQTQGQEAAEQEPATVTPDQAPAEMKPDQETSPQASETQEQAPTEADPAQTEAGTEPEEAGQEDQGIEPVVDEQQPEGSEAPAENQEAQDTPDTQDASEVDTEAETAVESGDAAQVEIVKEEVSYRLCFLVNGEEITPEDTVTFTVQALDEDGNEMGEPVVLAYNAGDGLDTIVATLVRETVIEIPHKVRKAAQDGNVRVIVEYDSTADIPEEAELQVRQITPESDPAYYGQREAEYSEQAGEDARMDLLLSAGFYADGTEVEVKAPVTITIQILSDIFEERERINVVRFDKSAAGELSTAVITVDGEGKNSTAFVENKLSEYALGSIGSALVRQESTDADGTVRVIAEYGPDAELPADAKLTVRRIKENEEDYRQREAEFKQELGDEEAVMGVLLNIGFYVDGQEVEPAAPVSITIQILDDSIDMEETTDVVHFGEEKESFKDVVVEENTDGNKTMSFEAGSFSTYALRAATKTVYKKTTIVNASELNGNTYLLAYVDGTYGGVLNSFAWNSGLDDSEFTAPKEQLSLSELKYNSSVEVEWTFHEQNGGGFYVQCADGKYLNIENNALTLTNTPQNLNVAVDSQSGTIKIYKTQNRNSYYVSYIAADKYFRTASNSASGTGLALYTKTEIELPAAYTIRYWQNEKSLDAFQNTVNDKGTLIGTKTVLPETEGENRFVRIPVAGYIQDGKYIGKLADLEGGYKFYGWSLETNSNYKWDSGHMVYCGEAFSIDELDGMTVPTYIPSGEFTVSVTGRSEEYIDVYATWAAPTNSVAYYNDASKVMFYIRWDGQAPNEPGTFDASGYTEGLTAKDSDGNEVIPLKYWMHIYGAGNEEAVRANLNCEPSDEDIYNALKEQKITIDGKEVNFSDPNADNYESLENFRDKYYVVWYVSKDGISNWHIDGTLMKKTKWTLKYDGNGVTDPNTIIPASQYGYKENAIVKNTLQNRVQVDAEPKRTGYNFTGWNTELDGSGTKFVLDDEITVDAEGNVYRKGEKVEGLKAEKAKGVWEVTLHAQWEKVTHLYTIKKEWADENAIINPLIKSIEIEITRSATIQETDQQGNTSETVVPDTEFKKSCILESSKNWMVEIELEDTDDEGNPYKYVMQETSIKGSDDGEISGAVGSYTLSYGKDVNKLYTLTNTLKADKTVEITVKKTDTEGSPLGNAVFKLVKMEGGEEVVISDSYISDDNGLAINKGKLIAGSYKLQEVTPPEGYLLNEAIIAFEVEEDKEADAEGMVIKVTSGPENGWSFDPATNTFTMQNKPATMSVKVKKVSDQNLTIGLKNAEFIVQNAEGKYLGLVDGKVEWIESKADAHKFVTTADETAPGTVNLAPLPIGDYYLTEVKAPDGYNLRESPIKFTIKKSDENLGLVLDWGYETVYPDVSQDIEYPDTMITVLNSTGIALPETGGPGTAMYTLGGLAIIATSLVYGLSMRRKKEKGGSH